MKSLPIIRRIQIVRNFSRSTIIILLTIAFQLLGCSEDTDNNTVEDTDPSSVETLIAEPIVTKPTPEDTFAQLKTLFPKPIFDEEFTTLSEVTASKTYLDFLAQEYPSEKPFETLEEYLSVAQPDPERYKPFLKEFIGKANEEDIAIVHQMTLQYRCANAILYHLIQNGDIKAILAVLEKKISVLDEAPVKAWIEKHFPQRDFFDAFEIFVMETERADTLLIQEQFEKHGKNAGILWVALRNPALIAEVLNNFTNTDVFLKWTDGDFFLLQP